MEMYISNSLKKIKDFLFCNYDHLSSKTKKKWTNTH